MKARRSSSIFEAAVGLTIVALLLASAAVNTANGTPAADIVALKTQQPFSLDGIPSEIFWGYIPAVYLPLEGTTTYGGKVPNMSVKAAQNGTYLFLLLQWSDAKESRESDPAKRLLLSTPNNLTGRYYYNQTYHYTDAAAVTWWMGGEKPTAKPATNDEFGPAPTRGTSLFGWGPKDSAELWVWKANALDLGNPGWPYSGIIPTGLGQGTSKWNWGPSAGNPYTMPWSSAYQTLYNFTGNWALGDGLLHSKACQQPGTTPFEVRARGVWSSGMWTLEIARPFTQPPGNSPYTITLQEGKTYWAVFAAFDGNNGEWEEVGSISRWVSLVISEDSVPVEKQSQEILAAIQDTRKAAQDALSAAQQAVTIAYAAIGLAMLAIVVAAITGLRARKP